MTVQLEEYLWFYFDTAMNQMNTEDKLSFYSFH